MIRPAALAATAMLVLVACNESTEHSTSLTPDQAVEQSIAKAEQIIQALENHKQEHLVYPASLEQLMPGQLDSLPMPDAGPPQWHYERDSSGLQFELGFGPVGPLEVGYFYTSAEGEWGSDG